MNAQLVGQLVPLDASGPALGGPRANTIANGGGIPPATATCDPGQKATESFELAVRHGNRVAHHIAGPESDGSPRGHTFVPQLDAVNGATLSYVRQGEQPLSYYVDDDRSSCTNNSNTDGPGGTPYACTGSFVDVPK